MTAKAPYEPAYQVAEGHPGVVRHCRERLQGVRCHGLATVSIYGYSSLELRLERARVAVVTLQQGRG